MSELFKLDSRDLLKGLLVTIIGAVLGAILQLLNANGLAITGAEWLTVLTLAITTGLSYLVKNLITDEGGKIAGKL